MLGSGREGGGQNTNRRENNIISIEMKLLVYMYFVLRKKGGEPKRKWDGKQFEDNS